MHKFVEETGCSWRQCLSGIRPPVILISSVLLRSEAATTVEQCPLSGSDCPLLFFGPLCIVCGVPERSLLHFIWTMEPALPLFS